MSESSFRIRRAGYGCALICVCTGYIRWEYAVGANNAKSPQNFQGDVVTYSTGKPLNRSKKKLVQARCNI